MRSIVLSHRQRKFLRQWAAIAATVLFFACCSLPFVCFSVEVARVVAVGLEAVTFPLAMKAVAEI